MPLRVMVWRAFVAVMTGVMPDSVVTPPPPELQAPFDPSVWKQLELEPPDARANPEFAVNTPAGVSQPAGVDPIVGAAAPEPGTKARTLAGTRFVPTVQY